MTNPSSSNITKKLQLLFELLAIDEENHALFPGQLYQCNNVQSMLKLLPLAQTAERQCSSYVNIFTDAAQGTAYGVSYAARTS